MAMLLAETALPSSEPSRQKCMLQSDQIRNPSKRMKLITPSGGSSQDSDAEMMDEAPRSRKIPQAGGNPIPACIRPHNQPLRKEDSSRQYQADSPAAAVQRFQGDEVTPHPPRFTDNSIRMASHNAMSNSQVG